ncbi:MAG: GNAT family N-acetyltransferase [Chitinophagaceae bacterium]|nr:GNAT family N-acetyltransferase [Chitinophagaceae bacterium]MCW5904514.1 GNAT family N-acetyltransferase [Chitinophagaceae bacterium]
MQKVLLRIWKKEDAQVLATLANNKNIWNNLLDVFPSPYTVMDALQWINKESNKKPITQFAIEFNHQLVGGIGITLQEDVYRNAVELGYFIGEAYWGKGIATEAIKVITEHIQQHHQSVTRIFARVFDKNYASMKALQKAGFYLEGIQKYAAIKNNEIYDVYVWVKLM